MSTRNGPADRGLEEILGENLLSLAQEYFSDQFIEVHGTFLLALADRCKEETWDAYCNLPQELVPEQQEFLLALADRCKEETGDAYHYLPKELFPEHQDFLLALADRCKEETWSAYHYLPQELVPEHQDFLLALADRCKEGTWRAYKSLPKDLAPEQYAQVLDMSAEQGVTHFYRYFKHQFPLLDCRLASAAASKKPLAVIIQNKNDENGAFSTRNYLEQLQRLLEGYAVCLFETDSRSEAFRYITQARAAGQRRRKISLLVLGGHGTSFSLNLGETPVDECITEEQLPDYQESYLSVLDGPRFAEMGQHIRKDGKIVLVSCSTGAETESERNLAQVISENIPHATVYAPKVATHVQELKLEQGKLVDVVYNCGQTYTAKLTAGRNPVSGEEIT